MLIEVAIAAIDEFDRYAFLILLPEANILFLLSLLSDRDIIVQFSQQFFLRLDHISLEGKHLYRFFEVKFELSFYLFKFPQNVKMLGMIIHNLLNECINIGIDIFFREFIVVHQFVDGKRASLFR